MRDIKTRFGSHWTGLLWLFGIPIAQLIVFVLINTYLRGRLARAGYEFTIYLVVAMIPYRLSTGLWGDITGAVRANLGLYAFRQVKPMDTMIARCVLEILIDLLTFVIIMFTLSRLGFKAVLPAHLGTYMVAWGVYAFLGFNIGVFLATIAGPLPRLSLAVQMLTMPIYITSGILFSLSNVPQELLYWFLFNPMLHLTELARGAWLPGYVPLRGVTWQYPIMVGLVFGGLGSMIYTLRRHKLATGD
jgi:capsular polysaccharide transport system permease protein